MISYTGIFLEVAAFPVETSSFVLKRERGRGRESFRIILHKNLSPPKKVYFAIKSIATGVKEVF